MLTNPNPACNTCGCPQVTIRPRYPGGEERVVCPTCLADRMAAIAEYANPPAPGQAKKDQPDE